MSKMNEERVNPIRITVDGTVYELDFSRESVAFAEQRGFKAEDVIAFPNTKVPELFFYALRKNHKFIARTQSDKLLESIGGMTVAMMERLMQLYNQTAYAHRVIKDEELAKNSNVTVEM